MSKGWLDVFVHPNGERFHVDNDPTEIRRLRKRCLAILPEPVVMEATGRYHRAAHANLHEAALLVAIVNPYRPRRFADAHGRLAKTNNIDTETSAGFGPTMPLVTSKPPTSSWRRSLNSRVPAVKSSKHACRWSNNFPKRPWGIVIAQITERFELCHRHGKELAEILLPLVQADPTTVRRFEIPTSVPGIGPVTAITLLVEMKELDSDNAAEVASLAGSTPINRDLGQLRGSKMIRSGSIVARNVLYRAATIAMHWNRDLASLYGRLRQGGKPFKVAITATMRKLTVMTDTLLQENRVWTPTPPRPNIRRATQERRLSGTVRTFAIKSWTAAFRIKGLAEFVDALPTRPGLHHTPKTTWPSSLIGQAGFHAISQMCPSGSAT
ncbi:transposase [Palleronia sp. LCG004]|uniref:transposase n=1 Tax=Palleronia sp. LCG004 TaxID=3079304 RepID=UPI002942D84F|nr:transposase [Palleronia sp. LCG004]WOI55885.1 transposase [Palleronia sp. LCG004]